jgi:hypothetical protein
MGSKWLKVLFAVVLSAIILGSVAALVYDMHPLRDSSLYTQQAACWDENRYNPTPVDCGGMFSSQFEAADRRDRWVGVAAGAVAVALFWLLAQLLYLGPRRRRREAAVPLG